VQVDNLVTRMLVVNNIAKDCRHQYVIQAAAELQRLRLQPERGYCARLRADARVPEAKGGDWIFSPSVNKLASRDSRADFTMHGNYPYCNLVEGKRGLHVHQRPLALLERPEEHDFRNQIKGQPRRTTTGRRAWGTGLTASRTPKLHRQRVPQQLHHLIEAHQGPRAPLDSFIAANVLGGSGLGANEEGAKLPPLST